MKVRIYQNFSFFSSGLWVIPLAFSVSGCARLLNLPDPAVLKSQYPVVHYHPSSKGHLSQGISPPPQDFSISLQRSRPPGWVELGSVSKAAVGAILVSEDWAFYQHKGIDPNQIRAAIKEKIEEGRALRGASTITQQVARNVFLSQDRNAVRKIRELVLAVRMEEVLGKRKILEIYLNIAELGEGIYGIGQAARFYFNKAPIDLSAKEGAFLAMLLPSPKRYSQSYRSRRLTDYARDTVDSILSKMEEAHYLTDEQREREEASPFSFELGARAILPSPVPSFEPSLDVGHLGNI